VTPVEFRAELKHPRGGYLFCGEEDYLKRRYLESLRKAVVAEDDVFNHIRLNGDTFSTDALASAIAMLPVMADAKLIEVEGVSLAAMSDTEIEELCGIFSLLENSPETVLVFYTEAGDLEPGTPKQPDKRYVTLSEAITVVLFPRETPARLAAWAAKHFTAEGVAAPPMAVNALLSRCGCDMYTLASEIDKLSAYVKSKGREILTEEDVALVASESKEIAAFDFTNALIDFRPEAAFSILAERKRQKEKPEILLSSITRVVCDLYMIRTLSDSGMTVGEIAKKLKKHEYTVGLYLKSASKSTVTRLNALMDACFEADLRIKSTSVESYAILDRLAAEASTRP